MFQDATFWVLIAFVVFVALVWRKASLTIGQMLDARAEKIRNELEEAQRLREDAQAALASFQRKQRDALKEAEGIIAHARDEAERLRKSAQADVEAGLKRREQQALDKIAQAEVAALAEVRNLTVDIALSASRRLMAQSMDESKSTMLIDAAIKDLPKHLN